MTDIEFAWRLYESERDFIKHHENQRTNASSILAAVSAALVVAVTSGATSGWFQVATASVLILIGLFGAIFSGKLYELIQLHASRSYEYLAIVNANHKSIDVQEIKSLVKTKQTTRYPYFSSISLNKIWFRFHVLVAILGILLTILAIADIYQFLPLDH